MMKPLFRISSITRAQALNVSEKVQIPVLKLCRIQDYKEAKYEEGKSTAKQDWNHTYWF